MLGLASPSPASLLERRLLPLDICLAHDACKQWVLAQCVVVVQILVAASDAQHSLRHHLLDRVLDPVRVPMIEEASCERREEPGASVQLMLQQQATIGGNVVAIERRNDTPSPHAFKFELFGFTLCIHRATFFETRK